MKIQDKIHEITVRIDKDLLDQKLNNITKLKDELNNEINSISEIVKIID